MAVHEHIPTFMKKSRDPDGNVSFGRMPGKNQVLLDVIQGLEFPPLEDEVLEIKLVFYTHAVCKLLDDQPCTLRPMTALDTSRLT